MKNKHEFAQLKPGDIVRHLASGTVYVIAGELDGAPIGVELHVFVGEQPLSTNGPKLRRGDIVRPSHPKKSGASYVVEHPLGEERFLGVRTVLICNPTEWERVAPEAVTLLSSSNFVRNPQN